MRLIWPLAIGIAISSALIGSFVFNVITPVDEDSAITLEEKCYKIAQEGFKIQIQYPDLTLEDIPEPDKNSLKFLDEIWLTDCVSQLPEDKILEIAQTVQSDYFSDN